MVWYKSSYLIGLMLYSQQEEDMNKKIITIDNTEIGLDHTGYVSIDTRLLIEEDNYHDMIIATTSTFQGINFTWVGNFIYRYETVIDIDPY